MKIDVLDHGYVRFVDKMGDDLSIANAARVSYDKESQEMSDMDRRLINFLWREKHCYDEKTEIFTEKGWLPLRDLTVGTRVAAVLPSGTMSLEHPTEIISDYYCGPMYRVSHRDADLLVTPGHNMFVSKRIYGGFDQFEKVFAAKLPNCGEYRLRSTSVLVDGEGGSYHDGWLLGFFLGDGYRSSKGKIRFRLKKTRKIDALETCLANLGCEFTKRITNTGVTEYFVVNSDHNFSGRSSEKVIPDGTYNASLEYRQGVFDGLLESDGSVKRGANCFSTSSESLAIGFQRLGTTLGKYVKTGKKTLDGIHRLMVLSRSVQPRINAKNNSAWTEYQGKVYCVTVSTGLVLVRRNGRICVSGNSSPFRHAVISFEVYAPLMVARQWWKHHVAATGVDDQNGWNESCIPIHQTLWSYGNLDVTVADLLKDKNIPLRSVNSQGQIVPNRVKSVWKSGTAPVIKIVDEFGNNVTLTHNHRVKTPMGWIEAGQLSVGDLIAHNGLPAYMNEEWLRSKISEGKTSVQIGEICGVSSRTIEYWKHRFNIKTGNMEVAPYKNREWLNGQYLIKGRSQKEIAAIAGCSTHTIRKWVRHFGLQANQLERLHQWNRENGSYGSGQIALTNPRLADRAKKSLTTRTNNGGSKVAGGEEHHSFKNDATNQSSLHYRARRIAKERGWDTCLLCDNPMEEVHHKDRDPTNNRLENLMGLCSGHHYLIHGKKPQCFGYSKIVSIVPDGSQEVYDIEMELEENFVAGGLVVHNSRRYVTEEPTFYIPKDWRKAPENSKQGSGENFPNIPEEHWSYWEATDFDPDVPWDGMPEGFGNLWTRELEVHIARSEYLYRRAMENGVAPEQARLFLPAYGMYVRWRWTTSLHAVLNFLSLRLPHDAQAEIKEYAVAVRDIVQEHFPYTMEVVL